MLRTWKTLGLCLAVGASFSRNHLMEAGYDLLEMKTLPYCKHTKEPLCIVFGTQ